MALNRNECNCPQCLGSYSLTNKRYQDPILENNNKNNMNNFFKKLTDKKIQTLVKAGYLNSELKITTKGQDALRDLLFLAHYDELVKLADEENIEAEKNKK